MKFFCNMFKYCIQRHESFGSSRNMFINIYQNGVYKSKDYFNNNVLFRIFDMKHFNYINIGSVLVTHMKIWFPISLSVLVTLILTPASLLHFFQINR
ncbi:hypothetical protein Avbf_05261 [Armadillidium vulgare]|nr:hypothetical protein Avbf_05261 [Armadillidium vulgare]